jgi:hypothetical protein
MQVDRTVAADKETTECQAVMPTSAASASNAVTSFSVHLKLLFCSPCPPWIPLWNFLCLILPIPSAPEALSNFQIRHLLFTLVARSEAVNPPAKDLQMLSNYQDKHQRAAKRSS